jgi:uncharacterized small protein (DUF1192 family)
VIGRVCDEPGIYRRRITPAESVPDDAGRRLVAGEPMTVAEMRHALGVARHEIARLTAERDAALRELQADRVGRCQPPAAPQPASDSDAQAARDQDRDVVQQHCAAEQAEDAPPASDGPGDGWRFVNVVGCRWCRER